MSFRFFRRIRILPGLTLNLSKSGGSLSVGPRGAKFTLGGRGKRATLGIPGTGMSYTTTFPQGRSSGGKRPARTAPAIATPVENRLTLGFFKRLVTPENEQALVDGCRELALGSENAAFAHLLKATDLADGAYLAGFLALKKEHLDQAAEYLRKAADKQQRLGHYLSSYGIDAVMSLPITAEVSAQVGPHLRGVLLGLVEAYQRLDRGEEARQCLNRLLNMQPDDVVVKLSLAELLLTSEPDQDAYRKVVRMAHGVENLTPIHAALMLYKGKALRYLGLATAALEVLTTALRRRKNRAEELLVALRYERALAYLDLGKNARARTEFEKIYAKSPDFADVGKRLGL